MKPSAKTAGQLQSNNLGEQAFPGGFSVPGGLGRMGTLLYIKLQHLLKSGSPKPLDMDNSRRKDVAPKQTKKSHLSDTNLFYAPPLSFSMCPTVLTNSKE